VAFKDRLGLTFDSLANTRHVERQLRANILGIFWAPDDMVFTLYFDFKTGEGNPIRFLNKNRD